MSALKKKRKNRYKRHTAAKQRRPMVIGRRLAPIGKCMAVMVLMAAMSLIFIFGHDYLTQCSAFKARQVKVEGNHRLTADQVLHQAGIVPGVNRPGPEPFPGQENACWRTL